MKIPRLGYRLIFSRMMSTRSKRGKSAVEASQNTTSNPDPSKTKRPKIEQSSQLKSESNKDVELSSTPSQIINNNNDNKNTSEQDTKSRVYPTNKTMPTDYSFIKSHEPSNDVLKIVSFNVNSLQAAIKKGFKEYVNAEDPDILCIQETKLNLSLPSLFPREKYVSQIYNECTSGKKGYSGTAVFSKIKPISVKKEIGIPEFDKEGRSIILEFDSFYLIACYVPNAGQDLVRLSARQGWDNKMCDLLTELEKSKPIIYAGDLNVSHTEIDLARPETNSKTAGFTKEEREGFTRILGDNRIDTFRYHHPDERIGGYSYYSYRFNSRQKLIGWRLDYFVVTNTIIDRVVDSFVRSECYGASDHVPVVLLLKN